MEPVKERKRRKWDVAAPAGVPVASSTVTNTSSPATLVPHSTAPAGPPAADIIQRAKLGALSVLEKINEDLRAQGAAPLKTSLSLHDESIKREVTINDAPGHIRFNLTKRSVQDGIARRTGTQVCVRGQYYPAGAPRLPDEAPLFLKITPGLVSSEPEHIQQQACDRAAEEVQQILQGSDPGTGPRTSFGQQGNPQQAYSQPQQPYTRPQGYGGRPQQFQPPYSQAQGNPPYANAPYSSAGQVAAPAVPLYVGVETPPEFNIAARLRGQDDAFLRHISAETRTQIVLRGRGSGMVETQEPLHVLITGGDQTGSEEAVRLAKNLIDTVREEYKKQYPYATQPGPQGHLQHPGSHPGGYPQHGPPSAMGTFPPAALPQAGPYAQQQRPGAMPGNYYPQQQGPQPQPMGGFRPQPYQGAQGPYPGFPQHQHGMPPGAQSGANSHPYHPPQPANQGPSTHHHYPATHQMGHQALQHQPPPGWNHGVRPQQAQSGPPNVPPKPEEKVAELNGSGNAPEDNGQRERKRRFKEVKETPPPVPSKPAPYAPQPMGPPPPRKPSPGTLMGPPAPRLPPSNPNTPGQSNSSSPSVSGSLAGLVDYE